jgi:hypothetical protein
VRVPERRSNGGGRALRHQRPGLDTYQQMTPPPTSRTSSIIADQADPGRQRQIRRLAAIEQTRLRYGPDADLRPTAAGPGACPADCGYCPRRSVA